MASAMSRPTKESTSSWSSKFYTGLVALTVIVIVMFSYYEPPNVLTVKVDEDHHPSTQLFDQIYTNKSRCRFNDIRIKLGYNLNPTACENNTKLIVIIHSAPQHFATRRVIRNTWAVKEKSNKISYAFLLGAVDDSLLQTRILDEEEDYCDIIQDSTFTDSYLNLTKKSVSMLRWTSNYCNVVGLLKADDDMWVNADFVASKLQELPPGLHGWMFHEAKPDRNPKAKWFVPRSQFKGEKYPDYLSGTSYLIINSAGFNTVDRLNSKTSQVGEINLEDVYITGLVAVAAKVKRRHLKGFNYGKIPINPCFYRNLITSHHIDDVEKYEIFKLLKEKHECNLPNK